MHTQGTPSENTHKRKNVTYAQLEGHSREHISPTTLLHDYTVQWFTVITAPMIGWMAEVPFVYLFVFCLPHNVIKDLKLSSTSLLHMVIVKYPGVDMMLGPKW